MRLRFGWAVLAVARAAVAAEFYAAPDGAGDGTADRPAALNDEALWKHAGESVATGPVEVILKPGAYLIRGGIRVDELGSPSHPLIIRGETADCVTLQEDPADKEDRNVLLTLTKCQNITLRDLHFRGSQKLGSTVVIRDSSNITIQRSSWIGLAGAYFSAMSVVGKDTKDVRVDECDFRRNGRDSHAHMIYCAYGPQRITVTRSHFEDCTGDYVRFRDRTDYCVVYGCTFISTGTYRNAQPPMVTVPLFNDENPAATKPRAGATQETFGTHFLIANNTFCYSEKGAQDTRWAMVFHHSGFDPPGKSHLLTPDEAKRLAMGPAEERRATLKQKTGIDLAQVHLVNNRYEHVARKLTYRSRPEYGAKSKGFAGSVDLSDLVSEEPVVGDLDQALKFYPPP